MRTTLKAIETLVCEYFDLTPKGLWAYTREKKTIMARHMFFYLGYKFTKKSLNEIGRWPPRKYDHATVLHGKKKIAGWIDINDREATKIVWELEARLNAREVPRSKILINHFNLLQMCREA